MPFLVLAFFLIFMNTALGGRRQCKAVATEGLTSSQFFTAFAWSSWESDRAEPKMSRVPCKPQAQLQRQQAHGGVLGWRLGCWCGGGQRFCLSANPGSPTQTYKARNSEQKLILINNRDMGETLRPKMKGNTMVTELKPRLALHLQICCTSYMGDICMGKLRRSRWECTPRRLARNQATLFSLFLTKIPYPDQGSL